MRHVVYQAIRDLINEFEDICWCSLYIETRHQVVQEELGSVERVTFN